MLYRLKDGIQGNDKLLCNGIAKQMYHGHKIHP